MSNPFEKTSIPSPDEPEKKDEPEKITKEDLEASGDIPEEVSKKEGMIGEEEIKKIGEEEAKRAKEWLEQIREKIKNLQEKEDPELSLEEKASEEEGLEEPEKKPEEELGKESESVSEKPEEGEQKETIETKQLALGDFSAEAEVKIAPDGSVEEFLSDINIGDTWGYNGLGFREQLSQLLEAGVAIESNLPLENEKELLKEDEEREDDIPMWASVKKEELNQAIREGKIKINLGKGGELEIL